MRTDLRKWASLLILLALLGAVLSACGSDEEESAEGDAPNEERTAAEKDADRPDKGSGGDPAERRSETNEDQSASERQGSQRARAERRRERRRQAREPALGPEEREAAEPVERLYDIVGDDSDDPDSTEIDSSAFCDLLSEKAKRQTIEYVERSSGIERDWNCRSAVEQLVIRSKRSGNGGPPPTPEVVGVNIEGDRATASIRYGRGPITSVSLVREDGAWKLGEPPGAAG